MQWVGCSGSWIQRVGFWGCLVVAQWWPSGVGWLQGALCDHLTGHRWCHRFGETVAERTVSIRWDLYGFREVWAGPRLWGHRGIRAQSNGGQSIAGIVCRAVWYRRVPPASVGFDAGRDLRRYWPEIVTSSTRETSRLVAIVTVDWPEIAPVLGRNSHQCLLDSTSGPP